MKFGAFKKIAKANAKFFGLATLTGYTVGAASAIPGNRSESGTQGLATGLFVAASAKAAGNKTFRSAMSAGGKVAGKIMFRRFRGRIIPIRVK